jgi:hypothetical protein
MRQDSAIPISSRVFISNAAASGERKRLAVQTNRTDGIQDLSEVTLPNRFGAAAQ